MEIPTVNRTTKAQAQSSEEPPQGADIQVVSSNPEKVRLAQPVSAEGGINKAYSSLRNPSNQQSVYVPEKDVVKLYPKTMSNEEIHYDINTSVLGKTPEEYLTETLPLMQFNQAFKQASQMISAYGGVEEQMQQGLKYAFVVNPERAMTGEGPENTPEEISKVYKSWLDLWREDTEIGRSLTEASDWALANEPLHKAVIPWLVAEFIPTQLLELGTRPSAWISAYGVEKISPIILNGIISKLPKGARENLFKDVFNWEKALDPHFRTLGLKPGAKMTEVEKAFHRLAKQLHPDKIGGDGAQFRAVTEAVAAIRKGRSGVLGRLYELFVAKTGGNVASPLQLNAKLVPFKAGDLVKIGEQTAKIIKVAGKMATINLAGKTKRIALSKIRKASLASNIEPAVNIEKMSISSKAKDAVTQATEKVGNAIENQTGVRLTNKEVIEKAKEADLLTKGISREATLNFEAALLKTRQHLAALAEENELTPEFLDALRVTANIGTDIARSLQSMSIQAMPELAEAKVNVIKQLMKLGKTSEEILVASKGVDFTNEEQVAEFYRKFVKPTLSEQLNEFAYMNILSSPLTHIRNAFTNLLQVVGLNPATKLASGAVDSIASGFTGAERKHYISQIPQYYKGVANAIPEALEQAGRVLSGNKTIARPDVKHLPTKAKWLDYTTLGMGKYVTRALEASDVFFRTLTEQGEYQALAERLPKPLTKEQDAAIKKEAASRAEYTVFRSKMDADNVSGQGHLLSAIDSMTNAVYRLRESAPQLGKPFQWFIRFVQTPMNILKQGIEHSPAGFATIPGAKDKAEQAGKAIVGSLVFAGGAWAAMTGNTTWAAPTGEKEKKAFYDAGMQPYSVRIGNKWVSYSKLGPIAYPLAMASAIKYYSSESPSAESDAATEKAFNAILGILQFFGDQSYVQGMGDLVAALKGDKAKYTRLITSIPQQMIPMSGLQGWVNEVIDNTYRRAETGLSVEAITQNLQKKLVGGTFALPPQTDSYGQPAKKDPAVVNAFSPLAIKTAKPAEEEMYRAEQQFKRTKNKLRKDKEKLLKEVQGA